MHLPEDVIGATIEDEDQRMTVSYRLRDIQWDKVNWSRHLPPGLCISQTVHTDLLAVFFRLATPILILVLASLTDG